MIARVSNKGQITIPIAERRRLGIQPNSRVEVIPRDGEVVIRPVKSITELAGCFREYAKLPMPDWDEVRRQTEKAVAEEVVNAGRTPDADGGC